LESIDQFRGLAILMMVLANYLGGVHSIPAWLKHSPGIGLTVIDLIAPLFIFAIGLTYRLSMRRRIANAGPGRAFAHFFERFMALLGMGSLAATGGAWLGFEPDQVGWGVLQAIGIAGLLALPLVRMPTWARLGVGLSLLALYQLLLDRYWLDVVTHWAHGGIHGSLGWAAMLILGTVLGDLFHGRPNSQKLYPWASVLTLVIGIALSVWIPVSKNRISASYVLISLGVSGVLFLGLWLLNDRLRVRLPLLSAWGQNPLLLYLLHYLLLGAFALPRSPAWYTEAPLWLMLLQLAGMLVVLSWVGVYLHRKKWILSL
jgi:predicted acyltransferase